MNPTLPAYVGYTGAMRMIMPWYLGWRGAIGWLFGIGVNSPSNGIVDVILSFLAGWLVWWVIIMTVICIGWGVLKMVKVLTKSLNRK